MTNDNLVNETFTALFAEANDFTKKVLSDGMLKNVLFWGNKAADRLHDLEDKLNTANGDAKPHWVIENLQDQITEVNDQLVTLRKMYKALKA